MMQRPTKAAAEPWWLRYTGAITDDGEKLCVSLPLAGTAYEDAMTRIALAEHHLENGTAVPGYLGIRQAFSDIRGGVNSDEALGLKRPKGGQASERRFLMAVDCLIEQRLRPSNKSDSATAKAWKERIENVGTARRKHEKKAGELLTIWIRWTREQCGIVGHSDDAILEAHLRAIRETNQDWYPPDRVPKRKQPNPKQTEF